MQSPWLAVFVVAAITFLPLTQANSNEPDKSPSPAADPMQGKKPGQIRDDNGLKMKLVWCPPGLLQMEQIGKVEGRAPAKAEETIDDDVVDTPVPVPAATLGGKESKSTPVKVYLTSGYWLGQCEVTQTEWKQVMMTEPWEGQNLTKEGDDFPATFVSWDDAMEFCRKLTDRERKTGRLTGGWEYTLPTEAQWERACRGRTESRFSFGDDESKLGEYAWFLRNAARAGERYAHQVGLKEPNPWGLHDMHGNVWELCRDYFAEKLPGGRDPETTAGTLSRVLRGGGFGTGASGCRSAARSRVSPTERTSDYGFRVAVSSVQPVK